MNRYVDESFTPEELMMLQNGQDPFNDRGTLPRKDHLLEAIMDKENKKRLIEEYKKLGGGDMYYELMNNNEPSEDEKLMDMLDGEFY